MDVEGDVGGPVGVEPLLVLRRRHAPPVRPAHRVPRPLRRRLEAADGEGEDCGEREEAAGRRRGSHCLADRGTRGGACEVGLFLPASGDEMIFGQGKKTMGWVVEDDGTLGSAGQAGACGI